MKWLQLLLLLFVSSQVNAAINVWVDQGEVSARSVEASQLGRRFSADMLALRQQLDFAPHERSGDRSHTIELPMPDGSTSRFSVVDSPIMHPDLALKYPDIRTFRVFGIDDETATGRIDIGPRGFYGMLFTSQGRVFIDPTNAGQASSSYYSGFAHRMARSGGNFSCGVVPMADSSPVAEFVGLRASAALARVEGRRLEYDIAVAATEEYAAEVGDATGAILTAINRVNEIYERDLGIRLRLVQNDGSLIEQPGDNAFDESSPAGLLDDNVDWLSSPRIEFNEFDLGHVFARSGGGFARISATCSVNKAQGYTGLGSLSDERFHVDYVAHEIGHQFGAEHTYNGTVRSCLTNRVANSAVEPGSGSTIMGYATLCGVEDIQNFSDPTFHALSILQIDSFVGSTAGSCSTQIASLPANNEDPDLQPFAEKTIPRNTAFHLEASASDADLDAVTYQWDQMDTGSATNAVTFGQDLGSNALFRTYEPRDANVRHFPSIDTQVRGLYDDAEVLPCGSREVNFRITARDGNGGQDFEDVKLTVDDESGPFRITSYTGERTLVSSDGPVTLEWNVAGTDQAPVSCSQVDIDLLTFSAGYTSYSEFPLLTTDNDGSAEVQIAPITSNAARARFRVSCRDNYFYDISDADLRIEGSVPGDNFTTDQFDSFPNNAGTVGLFAPACPTDSYASNIEDDDDGGGGSVTWMLPLFLLLGLLRRRVRACSAS